MNSDRSCIDADVLLEVILARKQEKAARSLLAQPGLSPAISALSAHLVVHFGRARTTLPITQSFLADYEILSLEGIDFEWAFANCRNDDFEDALQLAVAIRHGCPHFVTLDKTLHKTYKNLPTITIELVK